LAPARKYEVDTSGDGEEVAFAQRIDSYKGKWHQVDPYAIREAFLGISSPKEARAFLRTSGPFRETDHNVTFQIFKEWQQWFREYMLYGVEATGMETPVIELEDDESERIGGVLPWVVFLDEPTQRLCAFVNVDSVIEALGATIALDFLEGARFQACGWCKSIFQVTKNNGRMYCTQECAHRGGQKRRRAEARALRERMAKKTSKRGDSKGGSK
jgi:hypothetical protein